MTATREQQLAFIQNYAAYSESAAGQLHINPLLPLSQWALESDWGLATYVEGGHNLGGIMSADGSTVLSYPNVAAFVQVYVNSMRADCPNIYHGSATPESAPSFVFEGTAYNTVNPSYVAEIAQILTEIEAMSGQTVQAGTVQAYKPVTAFLLLPGTGEHHPIEAYGVPVGQDDVTHVLWTALDLVGTPYTHDTNAFYINGLTITGVVINEQRYLPWACIGGADTTTATGLPGGGFLFSVNRPQPQPQPQPTPAPVPTSVYAELPLEVSGNAFYVAPMAKMADGSFATIGDRLQLDTGADCVLVSQAVANMYGLPDMGKTNISGVTGNADATLSQITFKLGEHVIENVPCIIDPTYQGWNGGLFGANVFTLNGLGLTIRPKAGKLEIFSE